MAEMEVRIQGQAIGATTVPVSGAVTTSGTATVIGTDSVLGSTTAIATVANRVAHVTPAAITGNVTGATQDMGVACGKLTVQSDFSAVGTLTGTMTVQGSVESGTPTGWTDLGTIAVGTGVTLTTFATHLVRQFRINFSGAAGTGSITNRATVAQ